MALNQFGIGILFTAKDAASATIKQLDKNFRELDSTTDQQKKGFKDHGKSLATGMAMMAVGAGGLKASFNLAGQFGTFEQGLARVGAISMAGEEDLKALGAAAKQAGLDTQFSPTEAVTGLQNLVAVGFNAKESIELLNPALDFAAGGMLSVDQSTATVSSALKVFGKDAKDATLVADQLLKISNLTSLSANDLQQALGTVSRGANLTGQRLEEMLPAMGLVKNTGVDVSVAASSVSAALLAMAKNAKGFKKVGVEVADSTGKFRPMIDIVLDYTKHAATMTNEAERAALSVKLFGKFGATAAAAIGKQLTQGVRTASGQLLKGAEAADFLRAQMEGASGTAKEFKDKINAGFAGQMTLLKGSAETLAVTLGEPIAKALLPVIKGLIFLLNKLIEGFTWLPGPVKTAFGFLMTFGSALLFIMGAIKVATALFGIWTLVFGPLSAALATFGTALLAAFWPLLIVAAIIAAVYLIYDNWEFVSEALVDLFDWVVEKVLLAWEGLVILMKMIGKALYAIFVQPYIEGYKILVKILGKVRDGFVQVGEFIKGVWSSIVDALTPVFDFVQGMVDGISGFIDFLIDKIEGAVQMAKDAANYIADTGGGVFDIVTNTINPFSDDFGELPTGGLFGSDGALPLASSGAFTAGTAAREHARQGNQTNNTSGSPINLTVNSVVDGEVVASSTKKFLADERNRTFGSADSEDA